LPLLFYYERLSLLKRDELSLNRHLIPLVPAEAGTQFFGRVLGPWIPAFAGTNGDWFNGGANLNSYLFRKDVPDGYFCPLTQRAIVCQFGSFLVGHCRPPEWYAEPPSCGTSG